VPHKESEVVTSASEIMQRTVTAQSKSIAALTELVRTQAVTIAAMSKQLQSAAKELEMTTATAMLTSSKVHNDACF